MNRDINSIKLQGIVSSELHLDEKFKSGEEIYSFKLSVPRDSGTDDILVLRASNRVSGFEYISNGATIEVDGDLRTRRVFDGRLNRLRISVFCHSIYAVSSIDTRKNNICEIEGTLNKKPLLRRAKTSDRILCELQIKLLRVRNKLSYIPVIVWGRDAYYSENFSKGNRVHIVGRFQSRKILRHVGTQFESDMTYEISTESVEFMDKV